MTLMAMMGSGGDDFYVMVGVDEMVMERWW